MHKLILYRLTTLALGLSLSLPMGAFAQESKIDTANSGRGAADNFASFATESKDKSIIQNKVYVGFMVHLEDDWNDDTNFGTFQAHSQQIRFAIEVFNSLGGKLTVESALPFANACANWGINVLQETLDSGMGVGSHSNTAPLFDATQSAVDALVGPLNNRGISGGWGISPGTDWAIEATNLGFAYLDAPVFLSYLHIPQNERPDSVSDAQILDSLFHNPAPPNLANRIHPHLVTNAATFHTDTSGPLLLLSGSVGEMNSLAEGRINCFPSCAFDSADIDSFVSNVRTATSLADQNRLSVIYAHIPLHLFSLGTVNLYARLFAALSGLKDSGIVEYVTIGRMFELYDSNSVQCCVTPGDYNHNGAFNIADVTAGIARIFGGGAAPFCQDEADTNGDNTFNIADVTHGIARIFTSGPAPICGSTSS